MRIAIIIDDGKNESLLRFTETKLFFDSKNNPRDYFFDSFIVSSLEEATQKAEKINAETTVILKTGYFLTSTFLNSNINFKGVIIADVDDKNSVILYDQDTYVGFKKRCKYPPKSKQLYIVENMLKSILRAKTNLYLQNTDQLCTVTCKPDNLYGLASGWKTLHLAKQIGLKNLKSVTVFDINQTQLNYAESLHKKSYLPIEIDKHDNHYGTYNIPDWIDDSWWQEWHSYPVKFELINLYDTPKFPPNSLIWISNVFCFEPSIFEFGWNFLKTKKQVLYELNKESIILE